MLRGNIAHFLQNARASRVHAEAFERRAFEMLAKHETLCANLKLKPPRKSVCICEKRKGSLNKRLTDYFEN